MTSQCLQSHHLLHHSAHEDTADHLVQVLMVRSDPKTAQLKGSEHQAYHVEVADPAEDNADEMHIKQQWWEVLRSPAAYGAVHLRNCANGQYLMVHPTDRNCILVHPLKDPYCQHKTWYYVFRQNG